MMAREPPPHLLAALLGQTPSATAGPSSLPAAAKVPDDSQFADYDYGGDADAEGDENMFRELTFDEVLEDLNARFLVNLPKEERTLVRLYWQAEQAHWFYEDYVRPLNPQLPSLGQKHFTQLIIASSPILDSLASDGVDYEGVWAEYMNYKSMVPCCGGILLNQTGDKCLVVRGWKSNAGWSFPRGKININEPELDCAIREVEEETGFDLTGYVNVKDQIKTQVNSQIITMFIAPGVDESTRFEAQTRKEIGAIEWVKLTDLPTWTGRKPKKTPGVKEKKFYNVTPFVGYVEFAICLDPRIQAEGSKLNSRPLKKWLQKNGYNPNPPSKKKAKAQDNQGRILQPFYEESSPVFQPFVPQPAPAPLPERGISALDELFDRFIIKQTEELRTGNEEAVAGTDQKVGLKRLFGNLDVLESERRVEEKPREESDADDLARLLGGVANQPAKTQRTDKANRLLSLLKPLAAEPEKTPAKAAMEPPRAEVKASPGPIMRPHQVSLLSMLSATSRGTDSGPSISPTQQSRSTYTGQSYQTPAVADLIKPISLPTSPRPPSPYAEEAARKEKQRRLLEMTIAGMGLDSTAPSSVNHTDGTRALPRPPHGQAGPSTSAQSAFTPPAQHGASPSGSFPACQAIPSTGYQPHASPTKRHLHTGSTSSPANPLVPPGGPLPSQEVDLGYSYEQIHGPATHVPLKPHQRQHQPGSTVEQQRLLAALRGGLAGNHNRPPLPPNALGGMGPYQMGVPGQPGQPIQQPQQQQQQQHQPNLSIGGFPFTIAPVHTLYNGSGILGPHSGSFAPPDTYNHAHQQIRDQQQRHHSGPHAPHQGLGQGHRPPQPYQQQQQPGYNQAYLSQSSLFQASQGQNAPHQPMHQPQGQGYGSFPPPNQGHGQSQHANVLQPVPMPRQASMGLLAMINGESRR